MVQMVSVVRKPVTWAIPDDSGREVMRLMPDDKTTTATGLLQPALTIAMAVVVGFIVVAMISRNVWYLWSIREQRVGSRCHVLN